MGLTLFVITIDPVDTIEKLGLEVADTLIVLHGDALSEESAEIERSNDGDTLAEPLVLNDILEEIEINGDDETDPLCDATKLIL